MAEWYGEGEWEWEADPWGAGIPASLPAAVVRQKRTFRPGLLGGGGEDRTSVNRKLPGQILEEMLVGRRYADLETVIGQDKFDDWPGSLNEEFEEEFLRPYLLGMGWGEVRFCGGKKGRGEDGGRGGGWVGRVVQVAGWDGDKDKDKDRFETYVYNRE